MRLALSFATALSLCFPALVFALDQATDSLSGRSELTVAVTGLRTTSGRVEVALYANTADWEADAPVATMIADAADAQISVVFSGLDAGEYAVRLYHDVNGDGELNTGFAGLPQEPYGFSNNPRPRFRGARFDEAAFDLEAGADTALSISLTGGRS